VSGSPCAVSLPRDSATSWRRWRWRCVPEVARLVEGLVDGHPAFVAALSPGRVTPAPKPCPAGVGVKGGTSRHKGSGSRLRLRICRCEKPVRVRVASDDFHAHCDACGQAFHKSVSV
jgi:hypothetical protein